MDRAIPVRDLGEQGFSVHRMNHVPPYFVQRSINEALSRPRKGGPWTDEGVAVLLTGDVRALHLDGRKGFRRN